MILEPHPAVPGSLVHSKGNMPGPQPRMSTLFDVAMRTSKTIYQEITQPLLGAFEIMCRVHRSQNVVTADLTVERRHQTGKPLCSYTRKNLIFIHEWLSQFNPS